MNESFLQIFCVIFYSGKSAKSILIHVNSQRVIASDKDVNSHVIFIAVDQMRVGDVFRNYEAFLFFRKLLFIRKQLYSSSAA